MVLARIPWLALAPEWCKARGLDGAAPRAAQRPCLDPAGSARASEDRIPMQTVLIVVHLIIVLALIAVVLLQRSEGGLGLGGGGGGGVAGFMTGRGRPTP